MAKPQEILQQAISLIEKKGNDYQNPNSSIKQADYFPRGCASILDMIHIKLLRMRSIIEAIQSSKEFEPNNESLKDSAIDLINYASFFAAYIDGDIDGQTNEKDLLNRKK